MDQQIDVCDKYSKPRNANSPAHANTLPACNRLTRGVDEYVIPATTGDSLNLSVIQSFTKHTPYVLRTLRSAVPPNAYPSISSLNKLKTQITYHVAGNGAAGVFTNLDILVTPGSGAALQLILKTFAERDSPVIIAHPNYPGFAHDAHATTTMVKYVRCHNGDEKDLSYLEAALESVYTPAGGKADGFGAPIVYLSNPNLPIGYSMDQHTILHFKSLTRRWPSVVWIVDEAYAEWTFTENNYVDCANVIVVRTFSKAFAAAGIRVGYMMVNHSLSKHISKHMCTKAIPGVNIDTALAIMQDRQHYLTAAKSDLTRWAKWVRSVNQLAEHSTWFDPVTYSGKVPFIILPTKDAPYLCDVMEYHGIMVRDKTKDLGFGCVRICLADDDALAKVYSVLDGLCTSPEKIAHVKHWFVDIDKTIRESYGSPVPKSLVYCINSLAKRSNITFITDNRAGHDTVKRYMKAQDIRYTRIITPAKTAGITLTPSEQSEGYKILDDSVILVKFPRVSTRLMLAIKKTRHVQVIETDMWDDAEETHQHTATTASNLDAEVNRHACRGLKVPAVGSFLKLIPHDYKLGVFGKQTLNVNRPQGEVAIMVGDSNSDYLFARRNGMTFIKVRTPADTLAIMKSIT